MTPTQGSPPPSTATSTASDPFVPPRPSAATVRKGIIQTLASDGPLTARALESAVGRLLPATEKPSVEQQLQVLREGGYVEQRREQPPGLQLTDSGRRWWEGIQALAPQPA